MRTLMVEKHYKSITEVSNELNINKHVIRYWDSKFEGISTRLSNNKRRFFSSENIRKLQELKNLLYQNGRHNYSLDLAKKIINKKSSNNNKSTDHLKQLEISELKEILDDLRQLLDH